MTNELNKKAIRIKVLNKTLLYLTLSLLCIPFLFPLFFAFISSFKNSTQIFATPLSLPKSWDFVNYAQAWVTANFSKYFFNSVFLTLSSMAVTAIVTFFGAYILAKYKFKLNKYIFIIFISGLMVPGQITVIPLAYVFGMLHLHNNYIAIILLFTAFNIPMSTLILTSFIKGVPDELEEAAIMDGCPPMTFVIKILAPMVTPAISSISIFNFIAAWNSLLIPLVFISKDELKTIPIGLLSFTGMYSSDYGGMMAAIIIAIAVPIIVYLLLQEKVESGLISGSIKG